MVLAVILAGAVWGICALCRRSLLKNGADYRGKWLEVKGLWNEGAAFSLPVPIRWVWALSAGALMLAVGFAKKTPVAAGLLLGGGMSNLWERIRHGKVYDYLHFPKAPGALRRYVYNLADLAVFLGALLMLCRRK